MSCDYCNSLKKRFSQQDPPFFLGEDTQDNRVPKNSCEDVPPSGILGVVRAQVWTRGGSGTVYPLRRERRCFRYERCGWLRGHEWRSSTNSPLTPIYQMRPACSARRPSFFWHINGAVVICNITQASPDPVHMGAKCLQTARHLGLVPQALAPTPPQGFF
jgi:hypothetical protein